MPPRAKAQPPADDTPAETSAPAEPEGFEAVFARLEEISAALEAGGLSLERSVDLYEEGMRLAQRCQDLLTNVEQRIETLRQRAPANGEDARP